MGLLRVRHDWSTSLSLFTFMHWRRKWQPTPVSLPGKFHGRKSLAGYSPWGLKESDTTEWLSTHTHLHITMSNSSWSLFFSDLIRWAVNTVFGSQIRTGESSLLKSPLCQHTCESNEACFAVSIYLFKGLSSKDSNLRRKEHYLRCRFPISVQW